MSWTTPKTWQLNEILTSSDMNTYVRDNTEYLKNNLLPDYVRLTYRVASGTAGGTATAGSWQTRPINTENSDASGICTLASNEFTLAAGTYDVNALGVFFNNVGGHRHRLWSVTDNTLILLSHNGVSPTTQSMPNILQGRFAIPSEKTLRLEYRVSNSVSTNGLGGSLAYGVDEIYAVIDLWRVAQ